MRKIRQRNSAKNNPQSTPHIRLLRRCPTPTREITDPVSPPKKMKYRMNFKTTSILGSGTFWGFGVGSLLPLGLLYTVFLSFYRCLTISQMLTTKIGNRPNQKYPVSHRIMPIMHKIPASVSLCTVEALLAITSPSLGEFVNDLVSIYVSWQ